MDELLIKSVVTPRVAIEIEKEGGVKERWEICLDYRALAKFEHATGLDLKNPLTWDKLGSGETFSKLIWSCLARYSPTVTYDDVLDNLNPAAHQYLRAAMLELTFPGFLEAAAKSAGTSPNGQPDSTKTT